MTDSRPNLLVIMADQLRHDWLGCAGTAGVRTPHIDALAARGTRFTHTVTNAAICVPARMALATGLAPERTGALDNTAVLDDAVTYYQRLRDHDYRVGVIGKLDLAKSSPDNGRNGDRPAVFRWGFTHPLEAEGKMHAGRSRRPLGPYGHWLEEHGLYERFAEDYITRFQGMRGRGPVHGSGKPPSPYGRSADLYRDSVLPADAFEDGWLGQRAVEWIREVPADYPWHLFVSFVGPHDPYDPPAEWADRFCEADLPAAIPGGTPGKPEYASPARWSLDDDEVMTARRQYTASLALIDDQIGRIVAALEDRGLAENTVIAFTADHGEMLGDHGLFQKSVPYEAAMRVPLILTGPGVEPGASDALVELADLNPTLCELAGLPPQPDIDARSLTPLLAGDRSPSPRRVAVCSERHYLAIRSATHKYVDTAPGRERGAGTGLNELYDLVADPEERCNLFLDDPEEAARLRDDLVALARDEGHCLSRL